MGGASSTHEVKAMRYYIPRSKDGYRTYSRLNETEAKELVTGTELSEEQIQEMTHPIEDSGDNDVQFKHGIEFELRNSRLNIECTSQAGESLLGIAEIKAAIGKYVSFE